MLFRNFLRGFANIYYTEIEYISWNQLISPFKQSTVKHHKSSDKLLSFFVAKYFLHIYYLQNVIYLEIVYTLASTLLSLLHQNILKHCYCEWSLFHWLSEKVSYKKVIPRYVYTLSLFAAKNHQKLEELIAINAFLESI